MNREPKKKIVVQPAIAGDRVKPGVERSGTPVHGLSVQLTWKGRFC